jgi:membrane-bound serine protease (ClpP class)
MVDSDIAIAGLVEKGKLLTLTTEEALEHKIADFRAGSIIAVLEKIGAAGADVRHTSPNWGERLVRLITHPVVASLLLSLAMIGILLEIRTPGFGVPGAVGLGSLVLVLAGHYIVQLVGWEELLLVALGLGLIALEIFVIPGFGVAGVVGGAAVLAALTMALLGSGPTIVAVMAAAERVAVSLLAALAASFLLLRLLPKVPIGRRLMLNYGLPPGAGSTTDIVAGSAAHLTGQPGIATSPLRPVGFAEIGGERLEVVAEGEMIETGAAVVVARVDGNRIVVRRQRAPAKEMGNG